MGLIMNSCPKCGNEIPLKKFFFVSNFRNIKCPSCNTELLSDKITLSVIGGISGFSAALTVGIASVIYYLTDKAYFTEILLITMFLEISIFLAAVLITKNVLKFTFK